MLLLSGIGAIIVVDVSIMVRMAILLIRVIVIPLPILHCYTVSLRIITVHSFRSALTTTNHNVGNRCIHPSTGLTAVFIRAQVSSSRFDKLTNDHHHHIERGRREQEKEKETWQNAHSASVLAEALRTGKGSTNKCSQENQCRQDYCDYQHHQCCYNSHDHAEHDRTYHQHYQDHRAHH